MKVFKTVVADDHDVVRKGLIFLLTRSKRAEVVGEARDGREAVKLIAELRPDLAIIDIAMPSLNGIDAASQMIKQSPDTAVLILSMYADEDYILRALTAGVRGYLLKDTVESDLMPALDALSCGRHFFSGAIGEVLLEDYMRQLKQKGLNDSYELLTDREKEILQLLAEGKSNKDVAAIIDVSPLTVETHRSNLMQKLNLHSTAEIVLYAVRKKIIA
jgi:two-component system, NarL family, response regulator NreC